jgi:hypothetical protein
MSVQLSRLSIGAFPDKPESTLVAPRVNLPILWSMVICPDVLPDREEDRAYPQVLTALVLAMAQVGRGLDLNKLDTRAKSNAQSEHTLTVPFPPSTSPLHSGPLRPCERV